MAQWLNSSQVLAIMFTYDLDGNQMWVIGIGDFDGVGVTMEVLYPEESTAWGGGFDPAEVKLVTWGTFTLTWEDCNTQSVRYAAVIPGFGSATRDYKRLSRLAGTQCPDF